MNTPIDRTRFEELLGLLTEHALAPEHQRELSDLLAADPVLADEALALWQQDAQLRHILTEQPAPASAHQSILQDIRNRIPAPTELVNGVLEEIERHGGARARRAIRVPRGQVQRRPLPDTTARRPRMAWVRLALAASVIAALGVLYFDARGPARAYAVLADAPGTSVLRDGMAVPVQPGMALRAGDTVNVGNAGSATIRYPREEIRVELAAKTEVTLWEAEGKRLRVRAGKVQLTAASRPAARPMSVLTPHAQIEVRGTRCTLAVEQAGTRVDLMEGILHILNSATGESLLMDAGNRAVVDAKGIVRTALERSALQPEASAGLLALYTFGDQLHSQGGPNGSGMIHDVSGVGEPLNMTVGPRRLLRRLRGGGLEIAEGRSWAVAYASTKKITEPCRAGNAFTVEAWIRSAQLTPHELPHTIVALKGSNMGMRVDCGLMHEPTADGRGTYLGLSRTTTRDRSHEHPLRSATHPLGELAHVVYTRSGSGLECLYVNGVCENRRAAERPGTLACWTEQGTQLSLASSCVAQIGNGVFWNGEYHLVAIHGRALSDEEVRKLFEAGPRRVPPPIHAAQRR